MRSTINFSNPYENTDWLSTKEAAIYIRSFDADGNPCEQRIWNLVRKRRLTPHKPFGRLLFSRSELKKLIEAARQG